MSETSCHAVTEKPLLGDGPGDEPLAISRVKEFLASLGNKTLSLVPDLAKDEMKKRLAKLNQQAADMRRHFGETVTERSVETISAKGRRSGGDVDKQKKAPRPSNKKLPGGRGKLTEAIKDILSTGSKSRARIEQELKARKLSTNSIGTLLNRMKKDGKINHNEQGKTYGLPSSGRTELLKTPDMDGQG